MSKKSRATRSARSTGPVPRTVLKSPSDIVAIIPYLLGFDPVESVVVIGLEGPRRRFGPCFRLDLVDEPCDVTAQVDYIETLVRHLTLQTVLLVAFSSRPEQADPVMDGVCAILRDRQVEVHEALRADGQRWWSYACDRPGCCTPEGTRYDASTSRVAAEAVLAGMPRLPSRDALRKQFDPDTDRQPAVQDALGALVGRPPRAAQIADLIDKGLRTPGALDDGEVAVLLWWLQTMPRRDSVWVRIARPTAEAHFALWSHVMRCAPDDVMPPAGSLAAFSAWLKGTGVLASHATDRVLAVAPQYSMAHLMHDILASAVHPDQWDEHIWLASMSAGDGPYDGWPDLAG
ncbi:MAG: DUF4192 domain-containing protein [Nocardioidaceae bacterium]|nr:DUF4192 domain-containing protein [Nocardioidaceae bacterium]